jgi:phosphoserine phosphatase RsbU/P
LQGAPIIAAAAEDAAWVGIRSQIGDIVEDGEFLLEPGDVLVLYTNGVTEAIDADGELFDVQRLCTAIEEVADKTPAEIRDHLLTVVESWSAQTTDDITLFVVRYSPP